MQARHSAYGQLDANPLLDGDETWRGLNMAVEPDLLQPGEYAFARNVDMRRRKPTTRRGMTALAWGQRTAPDTDTGTVWGALAYRNPLGAPFIVKARTNNAEISDPTGGAVVVPYDGFTLSSEVTLVQCFNVVVMLRGAGLAPVAWVPPTDWVNPYAVGFTTISQTGSGGTQPIPTGAAFGILFKNRLVVPFNRDELAASDILNYTRYDPVAQQFKINQDDEQNVRGLAAAGRDSILVFKDHSIYLLENFRADLAQVSQDVVPLDVGLGARRTIVRWGKDVYWLGPDLAYYSLQQALDNRLQGAPRAFSDPVEPLLASIKPTLLGQCVARVWNKKLYLAVPMGDAATAANVILVHDFAVDAWVSAWTSALYSIHDLLIFPLAGRERLVMVHTDGRLFLMEEGYEDDGAEIPMELISRGYRCGAEADKRFVRGAAAISTWDPTYTIQTGIDGGNI
jgi:hypothetical protein